MLNARGGRRQRKPSTPSKPLAAAAEQSQQRHEEMPAPEAPRQADGEDGVGGGDDGSAGMTERPSSGSVASPQSSLGGGTRITLKDLHLASEAGADGVAGGTRKLTSTMDVAKNVIGSFHKSSDAVIPDEEEEAKEGADHATMGLLRAVGHRRAATKWLAKTKRTTATVLDKQRIKEKYQKPPRPPMKPLDLWWYRAVSVMFTCDALVILWFVFLAFVFFPTIDPRDLSIAMDPLAWNMSFASTAVFIAFKDVQMLLNIFTWFKIWLAFTTFLTLALFYGAIRYWMYIYFGDFPCFKGDLYNNVLGICADGMVLVGLTTACLYNCACCFSLYFWRQYKLQRLKEEGKLTHIKTVNDLLDAVDNLQVESTRSNLMIAGEALEGRRRGLLAKTLPPPADQNSKEQEKPPESKALLSRASTLRQQHALASGESAPNIGVMQTYGGGSQYLSQDLQPPRPRLGLGHPYVSIRLGPDQIWGAAGESAAASSAAAAAPSTTRDDEA